MLITNKITVDLARNGVSPVIDAVQYDANTRAVEVTLLAGSVAWSPPADVSVSVVYQKADRTKGWYDKLPDGTAACSVSGNVVTAILAPQALTAAGPVAVAIIFQNAETLNQLATFSFTVNVEKNPAAGKSISNDYYNYPTMADVNAAVAGAVLSAGETARAFGNMEGYLFEGKYELPFSISYGFLDVNTGEPNNSTLAAYTNEYVETAKLSEIEVADGYTYYVHYYDADKAWVKATGTLSATSYFVDTTYPYCRVCFSNAVELTVEQVKSIYKLYFKTKHEYKMDWIPGKFTGYDTGAESSSIAYSCTDFLKLPDKRTSNYIHVKAATTGDAGCLVFYDENKAFIFGYRGNYSSGKYFDIPENAKYFRVSCLVETLDTAGAYVYAHNANQEIINDFLEALTVEGATWEE